MLRCVKCLGLLLLLLVTSCDRAKPISSYSEDEVAGLAAQWANAASAGTDFAHSALCSAQGDYIEEALRYVPHPEELTVLVEPQGAYYQVEFHDRPSLRSNELEPPLVVAFYTKASFKKWAEEPAQESDRNWCIVIAL